MRVSRDAFQNGSVGPLRAHWSCALLHSRWGAAALWRPSGFSAQAKVLWSLGGPADTLSRLMASVSVDL